VQTVVNGGYELLIFVRQVAHSLDLSLSFIAAFGASKLPRLTHGMNGRARCRARAGLPE
jgi:hypothetical protein